MFGLIKDKKGFFSLMEAILSIFLIFALLLCFNMLVEIESPSLSEESLDLNLAQDTMELMSSKIDGRDYSLLDKISYILYSGNNSFRSKEEVKSILDDFFNSHLLNDDYDIHYSFIETNQLDGEVLSSNADYSSEENLTVAIRNHGNYSYKLYVF